MAKVHYEVVAAYIKKDGRVFCCQRGDKGECKFMWEFPGGKIEPNETKEQAIIREIKEELNSKIGVVKFLTAINHEYNAFSMNMYVYECELLEGNLEISEHIDFKWVCEAELNELPFAPADKKVIDIILKKV